MKTILITGATSGFGLAVAKLLAQDNKLILLARRQDRLDELKSSLGTDMYTVAVDVTNNKQVQNFFVALPDGYRSIDVLINSAGLALGMEPAQEASLEDWEQMVDTNIKGLLRVTRPALDIMKKQKSGLVINIGSVAATVPYKGGNVYGATKAFVRQFSRNLRTDLFGTGVKVTNIEPGAAETEFSIVRFKDEQKAKDYYAGWQALKAEDVAATIAWVINQPAHVNIDNIEIMPLDQTYGGMVLNKENQ
ncbi:MAG TPA: SDR family NAD(P)-dependent oxidoreductase [Candidatus Saccharimonadales bacterium]|nr:SDR family NAD(P)-dependent oxidoreductase [Candidatus Saccharimonadales bacterium]